MVVCLALLQNKSRQSCHATALECCKLLLAFDKDDPCGALQTIDYMALRAEQCEPLPSPMLASVVGFPRAGVREGREVTCFRLISRGCASSCCSARFRYEFLLRFVDQWDSGKTSLQLLPNFAFSTALASFRRREAAQNSQGGEGEGSSSTHAADNGLSPEENLIQACLLYPIMVVKVCLIQGPRLFGPV